MAENPQNTGSVSLLARQMQRQMNLKKRYSDSDSRSCVLVASSQYFNSTLVCVYFAMPQQQCTSC